MKIKLYTNSHSVSCSKVEFVLDFKSIELEKVEAINNYGTFSPTATVPCLSIDGLMISDSGAILEFLEEKYPEPSLLSDQPNINSKIRFLANLVDENCEKKYLKPQSPYADIKLIEEKMSELNMPNSKFDIKVEQKEKRDAFVKIGNKFYENNLKL